MRVAYVLPSLQRPGGWRSHAAAFLPAIARHVEPVLFVTARERLEAEMLFPGCRIFSLPVTQQASLSSLRGLAALAACRLAVQRGRFPPVDLVHSLEAYPTGLVGAWLARQLGCPHVLTAHGTYAVLWQAYPLDRLAYQRVLRQAARIFPISTGTAQKMRQAFGQAFDETRLHPILNGNHFYRSAPREEALNRQPPEAPTLLTVGDVKPRKGQLISLQAFERILERVPQARYHIVGQTGNQAYFRQLQELIAARSLRNVTFLGAVSEAALREEYRQASVFVLAAQEEGLHFEGFGLVYLEAGAYGLPVVATRTGGVADAVRDGETGLLAEAQDVDGLANAITRLLADPELAARMGRANRLWAETLTWERCAQETYEQYRQALAGEARP